MHEVNKLYLQACLIVNFKVLKKIIYKKEIIHDSSLQIIIIEEVVKIYWGNKTSLWELFHPWCSLHEPVGREQFIVFKKLLSAYLNQTAREKSYD